MLYVQYVYYRNKKKKTTNFSVRFIYSATILYYSTVPNSIIMHNMVYNSNVIIVKGFYYIKTSVYVSICICLMNRCKQT